MTPDAVVGGDVRLIASDLDGTLLDADGGVPAELGELAARLHADGVLFVPASGRSAPSVARLFDGVLPWQEGGPTLIADNGACVVHRGEQILVAQVPQDVVADVVDGVRRYADRDARATAIVLCTPEMAYTDCPDGPLLDQVQHYYSALTRVEDLRSVDDRVIKVAVADLGGVVALAQEALAPVTGRADVVRSGAVWVDVMATGVNKGAALRRLQDVLGVTPRQTMAFGDHLNDLEMLRAADLSYAVEGAQPEVVAAARLRAGGPGVGVLEVLRGLV